MPLVAKTTVNPNWNFTDRFAGYHVVNSVQSTGLINVRSIIFNDIQPVLEVPLSLIPFSAILAPFVRVRSFNPNLISSLGSFPLRHKFGTLTTRHDEFWGTPYFINYEKSVFPNHHCFFSLSPLSVPDTNDAGLPVEVYDLLTNSTVMGNGSVLYANVQPQIGIDAYAYDLSFSVIADIGFFYFAYANFALFEPVSIFITVF